MAAASKEKMSIIFMICILFGIVHNILLNLHGVNAVGCQPFIASQGLIRGGRGGGDDY